MKFINCLITKIFKWNSWPSIFKKTIRDKSLYALERNCYEFFKYNCIVYIINAFFLHLCKAPTVSFQFHWGGWENGREMRGWANERMSHLMKHAPSRRRTQRIDTRPQVATYGKVCGWVCARWGEKVEKAKGDSTENWMGCSRGLCLPFGAWLPFELALPE